MKTALRCCVSVVALLTALAFPVLAQTNSPIDRLPPATLLYFYWHGTSSLAAVKATNPVCRLWADPAYRPLRELWTKEFFRRTENAPNAEKLTPEEANEFLTLLENPMVLGVAGRGSDPAGHAQTFLVLDISGKQALFKKIHDRLAPEGKQPTPDASYAVGPDTIEKFTAKGQPYFQATVGNYFLHASDLETIRDLVPRFRAQELPDTSLTHAPEFQQTRPQVPAGSVAEWFLRLPDFTKFHPGAKDAFNLSAAAEALHLERLHAVAGGLAFTAEAVHAHGAVLADTSPGGIFDFIGESTPTFSTLAFSPAAVTFSAARMNLAALYQLIRRALLAALPPDKSAAINAVEAVAAVSLGMQPVDALQLFTGEFATLQFGATVDPKEHLYAAAIQNPEKVSSLLRHMLKSKISTEDQAGDTTFFQLAWTATDPKTREQHRSFYSLAVTPNFLLSAPRKEMLTGALARAAGQPTPDSTGRLADDPTYLQARAALPDKLTGIGYTDYSKFAWNKYVSNIVEMAEKSAQQTGKPVDPRIEALKQMDISPLSHLLHFGIGGYWKDADGLYFEFTMQ